MVGSDLAIALENHIILFSVICKNSIVSHKKKKLIFVGFMINNSKD